MLIIIEYFIAIILLFYSVSQFTDNTIDMYDNGQCIELGFSYFIASIVMFCVAFAHTKKHEEHKTKFKRFDWSNWNDYYQYNGGYGNDYAAYQYPTTHSNDKYKPKKVDATPIVLPKTKSQILADIITTCPQTNSSFSKIEVTEYKPTTLIDRITGNNKEVKTEKVINTSTNIILSTDEEDIYRAVSLAIQEYISRDCAQIAASHITSVKKINRTINVFYLPSSSIDLGQLLQRECVEKSIKRNVKNFIPDDVNFIKQQECKSFEEYFAKYGSGK